MHAPTRNQRRGYVSILAISPTRELAQQIADEGQQLVTFHQMRIQTVYGGTNVKTDLARFKTPPDILVATPGRLNDHLENNGVDKLCSKLKVLIFDEADQLLEMGFQPEIRKMLTFLPAKQTRQTLLFSATMPDNVQKIAEMALRTPYEFVDCVGKEQNTHEHVPQVGIQP